MSSSNFNAVLLEISNQLSAKQLDDIKFLCRDMIGKRDLEKINSGRELFQVFTERGRLGADNRDFLSGLLVHVHRLDLSEKLKSFHSHPGWGGTDDRLNAAVKAELDSATEVIAENLGRTWRKLGRKLGLAEVKLDSISNRHPTDLEETAVELLKEWRKSRGAEAQVEELIRALRACQYNLTADKVEHRLATLKH
ncbi:FAS-associated death domain protein [Pempheris klunzingeri]|uniref:FAS-associated death domain protein n=1 Tax=Pempheris klunzingeri TaxID=3127111 RepID=UPI003980F6C4